MTRLRAIVCTPRLPWPLDDGGRVGLWQIAWSLARHADTLLLSLVRPDEPPAVLPPALAELGVTLRTVPHAPPFAPVAAMRAEWSQLPITLERYRSEAFAAALRRAVREHRPDVVVLNHLHLATYADDCAPAAVVVREHNVETTWLERFARGARPPLRWYASRQAARMRDVEARLCEKADLVLAVQPEEATLLRRLAPRAHVEMIPVGVDFARFAPWRPTEPPVVLLAAAFGWAPNAEGARRFLDEGWDHLKRAVPAVRLRIAGKDMPESLAAHAARVGGEPVGWVPDMAAEFASASLLLVPLWVGAGARVKIIEALAAHLPVVSTPIGAEGLGLVDGVHARIADEPAGLATAAAALLRDRAAATALSERAFAHAREQWSLDAVAGRTAELCRDAVVHRKSRVRRGEAHG